MVTEPAEVGAARLLIASLRRFGGKLKNIPVRVFYPPALQVNAASLQFSGMEIVPLEVPDRLTRYPFGSKVLACACAEQLCPLKAQTLLWMDPNCLVLQPPLLYPLGENWDAAMRPVHIRNVGAPADQPLDTFWQGIYSAVGVEDLRFTVESFADQLVLRPYFNTHAFALRPTLGFCQHWLEQYESLLADAAYQAAACADSLHRVFLFQAVFSTLAAASIPAHRIRILPPTYNYPYHLQERVPPERRLEVLNDLITVAYEDIPFSLTDDQDFEVKEPLRAWLARFSEMA